MRVNGLEVRYNVRCAVCHREMAVEEGSRAGCFLCRKGDTRHVHVRCETCAPNGPGFCISVRVPGGVA